MVALGIVAFSVVSVVSVMDCVRIEELPDCVRIEVLVSVLPDCVRIIEVVVSGATKTYKTKSHMFSSLSPTATLTTTNVVPPYRKLVLPEFIHAITELMTMVTFRLCVLCTFVPMATLSLLAMHVMSVKLLLEKTQLLHSVLITATREFKIPYTKKNNQAFAHSCVMCQVELII